MVTNLLRDIKDFRHLRNMNKTLNEALDISSNTTITQAAEIAVLKALKTKGEQMSHDNKYQVSAQVNELPPLPINLRKDVLITVSGLPKDFHQGEAQYIANILLAYAQPIELQMMTESELLNKVENELIKPAKAATASAITKKDIMGG